MTTADIRLISVVVTLFVIAMDEVDKVVKDIRLEISEYKALMKNKRYDTATSVVIRMENLLDSMFDLTQNRRKESWHEQA